MDKVKKFLAKNVEWIALALGACFLLWMGYSYVYIPPVKVQVGPQADVVPAEIDKQIWDLAGKKLDLGIHDRTVVHITVPPFKEQVPPPFDKPAPAVVGMPGCWNHDVAIVGGADVDVQQQQQQQQVANLQNVTTLPSAAAIYGLGISQGHSNVTVPGAGAAQPLDKTWVSVGGMVPAQRLAASFADAKIPVNGPLGLTTVLRVELYRQTLEPAGTWSTPTEIAPPGIDALEPMPPEKVANLRMAGPQTTYLQYAKDNEAKILRPDFYEVAQGGDKWYVPGTPNKNLSALELVPDTFDPAHPPTDREPTPEEQAAVRKYKQQQAAAAAAAARAATAAAARAAAAQQPTTPRTTTGGGRRGGGSGGGGAGGGTAPGGFLVADPDRQLASAGDADGAPPLMPPRVATPGTDARPPAVTTPDATATPGAPAGPASPTAPLGDLPKPAFVPKDQPDFMVWAHDDTVQPGKTYRYMLRYVIASPVFNTNQLCKPQKLALQFAIVSADSKWTDPVAVESDTNFYAIDYQHGLVKFAVFKWQNGAWQMQMVDAAPGDQIGAADPGAGVGGANSTGWTLVDVRDMPPGKDKLILLASDNGTIVRQLIIDQHTKKYITLRDEALAAAKRGGSGPGGPGGPGDLGPPPAPGQPGTDMPPGLPPAPGRD
jgi:hypothetical protein